MLRLLLALALVAGLVAALRFTAARPRDAEPAPAAKKVRLAVVVVFDQLRGDYVSRWHSLLGDDGFVRMEREGASFTHCDYPYSATMTGPGHASILTGTTPRKHGIVGNDWYDQSAGEGVYCAGHERYEVVPKPPAKPKAEKSPVERADPKDAPKEAEEEPKPKKKIAGTPERCLTETVADRLKAETGGAGKVFGVSLKDRSGVLPSGKRPDGVFWFTGQFVTSTYYADKLPAWVAAFNASGAAGRWFGKPWERLRPEIDYAKFSGPDDARGEGKGRGQGVTFPHPTDGGGKAVGPGYYEALANSPFGNDLLLEFAKACIEGENLGGDDVPDLLTISFSSNDLVGHAWGPDSQEVLDTTLRSDRVLAELLRYLDGKFGRDGYALTLTADHGVCPLPESGRSPGAAPPGPYRAPADAARMRMKPVTDGMEAAVEAKFGKAAPAAVAGKPPRWIEGVSGSWVYFSRRALAARGVTPEQAAAAAASFLPTHPDMVRGYVAARLDPNSGDPVERKVWESSYPGRSGDLYALAKPYRLASDPATGTGTSHGTPYGYDTHVPLMVRGPGVAPGFRDEPAAPQHAAAIVARFLGVAPPPDAATDVPPRLWAR